MSRVSLFCLTTLLSVASVQAQVPRYLSEGKLVSNDARFDELVPPDSRLEILADGFHWTEGPVWRADSNYVLFSDIPANTIYKWQEGAGLSIFMRPAGHNGSEPPGEEVGTNGLFFDAEGRLVTADHGDRQIYRLNEPTFTKQPLATHYDGKRLNSPNDLVIARNGNLYFTDPPYGLRGLNDSPVKELDVNGVYLLRPEGDPILLDDEIAFPNGILLSPNEETLYVAVSDGRSPVLYAYDVETDGTVANKRVFFDASDLASQGKRGAPDGLTVDVHGHIFTTGPGGVLVLSSEGEYLGSIETGQATANVTFGGPDRSVLYITADRYLLRIPVLTTGYVPFP